MKRTGPASRRGSDGARYETAVLFGGTGFIGRHLARHLLDEGLSHKIYLCDIVPPERFVLPGTVAAALTGGAVEFLKLDVRNPVDQVGLPETADLVVNLAAIHREPGHEPEEYFETNQRGAENVCAWSAEASCPTLIFTSSIAPYGPSEAVKTESSAPAPATPYGRSKLAAEQIHRDWQSASRDSRALLIVRPGVVFGPGEGGNVSRMIRALRGHYFFFTGNRQIRKAGGYVKELCRTMIWALERQERTKDRLTLYNFSINPPPTIEEFVQAICRVAGIRPLVPNVPYSLLLGGSMLADSMAKAIGFEHPFSPVRVRKLVRSNNVVPELLTREGYPFHYSLETALEDWRAERPDEWGRPAGDPGAGGPE